MLKNHETCKRGFHWTRKAWYCREETHEIMFGMYGKDGRGTTGEIKMIWKDLRVGRLTPQLCVFNDGWSALASFPDLIARLGEVDSDEITEDEFVEILLECGFEDLTEYEEIEK